MKRIIITESQYKTLLSKQRTEGQYSCADKKYKIKDKKGNLYEYINDFLGVKKEEPTSSKDDKCMKKGSRLKLISNKISKDFKSENISNFGCVIRNKSMNKGGVNYTLSFSEEPNIYKISFNSNNPFKVKGGSVIDEISKKDNELKELLNQELKSIVINGKYKINQLRELSLYYIMINKINGKKYNIAYNREQNISVIDDIINSFEISGYKLSDEEKKKINPIEWSANQIEDRLAGWTSDDDFMEIYQEIINYNCNDLDKLKKTYNNIYKIELRNDINSSVKFPSWKEYIDDLSDYLNDGCSDENKKKLVDNLEKMKND